MCSASKRSRIEQASTSLIEKQGQQEISLTNNNGGVIGFMPYYLENDNDDFHHCKITVGSSHYKRRDNDNKMKNFILSKGKCKSLINGYFRSELDSLNSTRKIMVRDLANIVLNYFGGDTFEIIGSNFDYSCFMGQWYSTLFFDLIESWTPLLRANERVTLNLKLNKNCGIDNKCAKYGAMVGLITFPNDLESNISRKRFFSALNEWQGMYNIHKKDPKTGFWTLPVQPYNNPFNYNLVLNTPIMEKNGFKFDMFHYYYCCFLRLVDNNNDEEATYKLSVHELKDGKKSMVELNTYGSSVPVIDWGDTICATIDSVNNNLILGAKISKEKNKHMHNKKESIILYKFDLIKNSNYVFVVTVPCCSCYYCKKMEMASNIDIDSLRQRGMNYQISVE